ncbi:glycosyltransferase [Acidothermaceae bacterium B102]|nr:glycosyltransferase [Acidothermaceae bacterium B102]
MTTAFTVVIPAHDEEAVIARCLDAFVHDLAQGEARVVVAANGCHDGTVEIARRFPDVRVLDLPDPSKTAALNAADDVLVGFPRIYLDADIVVTASALRAVAAALSGPEARVAAPRIQFRLEGRPRTVRMFYAVYEQLPYVQDALIGLGFYGLSAAGRERVGRFPDITADDLYVDRMFTSAERSVVTAEVFEVEVPRTLRDLISVRVRTVRGSRDLGQGEAEPAFASSTGETVRALAALVRRDVRLLPAALVYTGVMVGARVKLARLDRAGHTSWERDGSTR